MGQYIKIDDSWKHIKAVYKKVNSHWVKQEQYDFDDTVYMYSGDPISFDVFLIVAEDSYVGRQFFVIATLNSTRVNPTWSITSGNQYATINNNGKVVILQGAENGLITIRAAYQGNTDTKSVSVTFTNQMTIEGADTMSGVSGNVIALYNGSVVNPTWTITSGNQYATITQSGEITIINSGEITISATYSGMTVTKTITLVYDASMSSQTQVDPDTGAVTTTETTTSTDPETGAVTESSTSMTTNDDGSTSETTSETVTNTDGSSSTTTSTVNSDGSSSESTVNVSAADSEGTVTTSTSSTVTNADGTSSESTSTLEEYEDGSSSSNSETLNYDENGDLTGSTTNNTDVNADGSSNSSTTNYDASGDPTDQQNVATDTTGNVDTQDVEFEDGEPVVVGYNIDTTASEGEGKEIEGNGINTEFVPFKFASQGFVMHFVFETRAEDQPRPPITEDTEDAGNNYLYTVLGAKSTVKVGNVWPGFEIRWVIPKTNPNYSDTSKCFIQFNRTLSGDSGSKTSFTTDHNGYNVYDITVTYDPNQSTNKFVVRNNITNTNIQTTNKMLQDDLELDMTIGYSTDHLGDQIRHSNVIVHEFNVQRLSS